MGDATGDTPSRNVVVAGNGILLFLSQRATFPPRSGMRNRKLSHPPGLERAGENRVPPHFDFRRLLRLVDASSPTRKATAGAPWHFDSGTWAGRSQLEASEAASWILSPVFSTSCPNPFVVAHDEESPAKRSTDAPAAMARSLKVADFVGWQLVFEMMIGFMVPFIPQVLRHPLEKPQHPHSVRIHDFVRPPDQG